MIFLCKFSSDEIPRGNEFEKTHTQTHSTQTKSWEMRTHTHAVTFKHSLTNDACMQSHRDSTAEGVWGGAEVGRRRWHLVWPAGAYNALVRTNHTAALARPEVKSFRWQCQHQSAGPTLYTLEGRKILHSQAPPLGLWVAQGSYPSPQSLNLWSLSQWGQVPTLRTYHLAFILSVALTDSVWAQTTAPQLICKLFSNDRWIWVSSGYNFFGRV